MHRRWLLLGCAGVGAAAAHAAPGRAALLRLHRSAPRSSAPSVRAPDAVTLAGRHDVCRPACRGAATPALLQDLGITFTAVAENLETKADGDPTAARALGYLIGAARRGIEGSSGTSAELHRARLERSGLGGRRPGVGRGARRGPARRGGIGMTPLRLRLFHAADGTRVAYREAGVGPGPGAAAQRGCCRTGSSSRSSSTSPTASA